MTSILKGDPPLLKGDLPNYLRAVCRARGISARPFLMTNLKTIDPQPEALPLWLLCLGYGLPLVFLGWFVVRFSVNVPYEDQWELINNLFIPLAQHPWQWQDFVLRQNEHLLVFPSMIFAGLAFLSHWNVQWEMSVSLGLAVATAWLLARLSYSQGLAPWASLIAGVLVFGLGQWENWLWGFQLAWFLINFCLVAALVCLARPDYGWGGLGGAVILGVVASFSSAQGLLVALALVPLVFTHGPGKTWVRLGLWGASWAVCLGLFMWHYPSGNLGVPPISWWPNPWPVGHYFFILLGTPLSADLGTAAYVGGVGLCLFLLGAGYTLGFASLRVRRLGLPWLCLGLFALLFAVLTTLGRAGLGIEQATSSRYTTTSGLLFVSLVYLAYLCPLEEFLAHRRPWRYTPGVVAGLILFAGIDQSFHALGAGQQQWLNRQVGRACLQLVQVLAHNSLSDPCLDNLYPDAQTVRQRALLLAHLGWRHLVAPQELSFDPDPGIDYGHIDTPVTSPVPLPLTSPGQVTVAGWAVLPGRSQPTVALLSTKAALPLLVAVPADLPSPDVARTSGLRRYSFARWSISLPTQALPSGVSTLQAWVYDQPNPHLARLQGKPLVDITPP